MDAESPDLSPRPTSDLAKIAEVTPTFKDVADVLGHEHWTRDEHGPKYEVTKDTWAPEVNRHRMSVVNEMMERRRQLQTARSMELGESRETVTVRGPDGGLRTLPAESEAAVSQKPGFHAKMRYRPSKRFVNGRWYDGKGNPIG